MHHLFLPTFLVRSAPLAITTLALLSLSSIASAQIDSPVQSYARTYGLSIVDDVQLAGSDAAAASFQTGVLPSITELINTNLSETSQFSQSSAYMLDPTKLQMSVESNARVYFVGEGAGYHNTLGFNTLAPGESTPTASITNSAQLIFPDVSSSVSTYDPGSTANRSYWAPLLPGDFTNLGSFAAGTTLDFFLVANGANTWGDVWTAPATRNSDGINHVVAFAVPDSPFLILAFEDLAGGGDRDYNDAIFAVDIGAINVQRLLSTPEPAAWVTVLALVGIAWVWRRRMGSDPSTGATA